MSRREYPRDVSDDEWAILEPLIPPAKPGGHPQTTDRREVIKALFSPLPHRRPMASFTARPFRPGPPSGATSEPFASEQHLGAHPYCPAGTGADPAGA